MKKNYLFLAAAATMFTACVQTDVVNDIPEPQQHAISFDAFANKTTRAEIVGVEGLKTAKFKVWGYKAPRTTNANGGTSTDWADQQTVFDENGTNVEFSDQMWKPTDTKYWDKMSNYNFYAAAPAEPTDGATYSIVSDMDATDLTPGFITISNVTSSKSKASNDFLIARGGAENITGNYTTQHDNVSFNFHHTMAKITFKLEAAINENITVTSLKMTGWNDGVGKFTQKYDKTPTSLEKEEWAFTTTVKGNATLVGTGAGNEKVSLTYGTPSTLTDTYIMVPQEIAAEGLTFTLDYVIGDPSTGEKYTAQVGTLKDAQVWGTDSHTTYTISVGPAEINFSVNVCNWDAGKPSDGVTID